MNYITSIALPTSLLLLTGCWNNDHSKSKAPVQYKTIVVHEKAQESKKVTSNQGSVVNSGKFKLPSQASGEKVLLPNGNYIQIQTVAGVSYIPVKGIIDSGSYGNLLKEIATRSMSQKEQETRLQGIISTTVKELSKQVSFVSAKEYPEIGFFFGLIPLDRFEDLAKVENLPLNIHIAPDVIMDTGENFFTTLSEGDQDKFHARSSNEAYSGLRPMGVLDFVKKVEKELDEKVDGSLMQIGVIDTGITYNHPTFMDAKGKSRILHMKDFTAEGKIYFDPQAKFEVVIPAEPVSVEGGEQLIVNAEVIAPSSRKGSKPNGKEYVPFDNTPIFVNAALAAKLKTAGSGAKLGAASEASFNTQNTKIDINLNGVTEDFIFMLLIPKGESYEVYSAPAGTLDFRGAEAKGDFNLTQDTLAMGSEKVGFDIRSDELLYKDEEGTQQKQPVIGVSFVGYDPGNHGSHVAGIMAGRKTISNDEETTLARGVVPNASIMLNRVCMNNGGCFSDQGLIDLAQNGAEVINMSIGGLSTQNDEYTVTSMLIDRLTEKYNTLIVVSAGNSGPGINTVGSPSTSRLALSVAATANPAMIERQYQWHGTGAIDEDKVKPTEDFVFHFSSRGPAASGGFKPNISAPGTELSAIQLNAAPGSKAGLDVYWGTSMASPSAAGAIALLVDAAKKYNKKFKSKLPTDALTIRKVIIESAKPFDAMTFKPGDETKTFGQYTWIDQGVGMINLPRAWKALKAERNTKIKGPVFYKEEGGKKMYVNLDYKVRVENTNPMGIKYDGSEAVNAEDPSSEKRMATGLWLNPLDTKNRYDIKISRSLPNTLKEHAQYGEMRRQLLTSQDQFKFDVTIYGSHKNWIKVGVVGQTTCVASEEAELTLLGEGAVDSGGSTAGYSHNTLNVCINRKELSKLAPGDHGALIKAYKFKGEKVESNASFIVPVYVSQPHSQMKNGAQYVVESSVQSFGIKRNYIAIPEGVSRMTISLEVPEAVLAEDNTVSGCSAVRLYVQEGSNVVSPTELRSKPIAYNCNTSKQLRSNQRFVSYTRHNPKAGIWNLNVMGWYRFPLSSYKLKVTFVNYAFDKQAVIGDESLLEGSIGMEVLDSSEVLVPAAAQSTIKLNGLFANSELTIEPSVSIEAGDRRTYNTAEVSQVVVNTSGATGSDLDLYVYECDAIETELTSCVEKGKGISPIDAETVAFTPVDGKFYAFKVQAYSLAGDKATKFSFGEIQTVQPALMPKATLTITSPSEGKFELQYVIEKTEGSILFHQDYLDKKVSLLGAISLKDSGGANIAELPLLISK